MMKSILPVAALIVLTTIGQADEVSVSAPVSIIYDTDIGNDVDDVLALGLIHALADMGECKLLAVTITKDNCYAAPMVDLLNTFYGRGDIPIGVVRNGVTPEDGTYLRAVSMANDGGRPRYPHDLADGRDAPEAVGLLRKTLADAPDASVVIVQVGFSTNLARLLDSQPDEHSPWNGRTLVKQKVRLLSIMAGRFTPMPNGERYKEYNVVMDVESAINVAENWPTPIIFSGYEVGEEILYPARSIERDFGYAAHHPLVEAYKLYMPMPYDRQTWDLTSVLYAVRPDQAYFGTSQRGKVVVENDGATRFESNPEGLHQYLTLSQEQRRRVLDLFVALCRHQPGSQSP